VEAVIEGGYPPRVGADIREQGLVLWVARARVISHYKALEPHYSNNRNGGGEDVVVPVAGQEHKFRDNRGHQPVGFIIGAHG
jgi:hypothetical protein